MAMTPRHSAGLIIRQTAWTARSMHWRSAKESDARGADTDSRSYLPRAAPLARGPPVVLRLGHAAGDRRRPRGQQRGRSPRAVVPTVRRLAAGRAAVARLGEGWPHP